MDGNQMGAFLRQLRREQNLTQEQLAEALGVTGKTVSRWETGSSVPSLELLERLSRHFSVTVPELLQAGRQETALPREQAAGKTHRFPLEVRAAYYRKKWLRDHAAVLAVLGLVLAGLLAAGICLGSPLLTALAPLGAAIAHGWRHNAMMAYVEARAFDGIPDSPEET